MEKNQIFSNNVTDNAVQEYKVCAGKGCNKVGIHNLMIIYINKRGYFCDTCKTELEKCGLVNNQKLNSIGDIIGKSF